MSRAPDRSSNKPLLASSLAASARPVSDSCAHLFCHKSRREDHDCPSRESSLLSDILYRTHRPRSVRSMPRLSCLDDSPSCVAATNGILSSMAVGDCLPESRRRLEQRAGRITLLRGLPSASTRGDAGALGQRRCDCKAHPCDDDAEESRAECGRVDGGEEGCGGASSW